MKENVLLISFSGGRTSAFMTKYLIENKNYDKYNKEIVFVNTGKEREETLMFINECDKRWNLGVVWIETVINEFGKNTFQIVNFNTANRTGKPFEDMNNRYGIPNQSFPHCTRELKINPLYKYMRSRGYKNYITAIGIRADEPHRLKPKPNIIYPLAYDMNMTADLIRRFWDRQDFDLQLKDYEGNCDLCWKKSKRKKLTLIKEKPGMANWWDLQENKFSQQKYYFHRNNESTKSLIEQSKIFKDIYLDKWDKKKFQVEMDFETECYCKAN